MKSGQNDAKALESRAGAVHGATTELLDLLIEQVVDYAIFVIDRDGRIASWNAGAQRIKGYSASEIIGQPYAVFFTEEDRRAGKPRGDPGPGEARGPVRGGGVARPQGRSALLGLGRRHRSQGRRGRAQGVREDHTRPHRAAARRRGGSSRRGGAGRAAAGRARRARRPPIARPARPHPAQHRRRRDRAALRRSARLRERGGRAALRVLFRRGDARGAARRGPEQVRARARGREALPPRPAAGAARAGGRDVDRRREVPVEAYRRAALVHGVGGAGPRRRRPRGSLRQRVPRRDRAPGHRGGLAIPRARRRGAGLVPRRPGDARAGGRFSPCRASRTGAAWSSSTRATTSSSSPSRTSTRRSASSRSNGGGGGRRARSRRPTASSAPAPRSSSPRSPTRCSRRASRIPASGACSMSWGFAR